jgi:hypothetical protein
LTACSSGVARGFSLPDIEPIDGIEPPPAPNAVQVAARNTVTISGLIDLRMGAPV